MRKRHDPSTAILFGAVLGAIAMWAFTERGAAVPQTVTRLTTTQSLKFVGIPRNCDQARAAGIAPIARTSPNYAGYLDADGDGVACEPKPLFAY